MNDAGTRIDRAHAVCAGCINGATAHLSTQERLQVFQGLIGGARITDTFMIRLYMVAADSYIAHFAAYRVAQENGTTAQLVAKLQQISREYEATRANVLEILKCSNGQ
jgi:hypothetical protein